MAHKGRGDILKKIQVPISYGLWGKLFLKILRKRMSELWSQWINQSQICLYDSSGFTMVTDMQNVPSKPSAARVNFWSEHMHFFVANCKNIFQLYQAVSGNIFLGWVNLTGYVTLPSLGKFTQAGYGFPKMGEVTQAGYSYPRWVKLPRLGKITQTW